MGCDVYANGNEVSCKASSNKTVADFPDVCMSPPSPPAGPIPLPYPNSSFSKDMKKGSKTVKIKKKPIMLKDKSFYKTSPLGDEAATKSFGSNTLVHGVTGKTYFVAWSMDVKAQGANVCRHIDFTTSNHACPNPGTPTPSASAGSGAPNPPCPKCGANHPPDPQPPASPTPHEMKKDEFEKIATDPSSKKIEAKNMAEVEAGIAAQGAGLIGKIVPPPASHGGLEMGYDLMTDLGEEIDVKAFRPHDTKPGALDKTVRNANVPPAKKKILLDPRNICDQQVKQIEKELEAKLGKGRVIVAPRTGFRPIKLI